MSVRLSSAAVLALGLLAGCSSEESRGSLLSGKFGPAAMSENEVRAFSEDKTRPKRPNAADLRARVLSELDIGNNALDDEAGAKLAVDKNLPPPGPRRIRAEEYTAAGYSYVYRQCSNYFDGLIMLQNENGFNGDLVSASGSAVATIMGLVRASSASIGAIAATTGFASTTFNAFNTRALMTPYPTETKTLILGGLDDYRAKYPPDASKDAATAILNVQHYAELCTYSGITRAAKKALAAVKIEASPAGGDAAAGTTPQPSAEALALRAGISAKLKVATMKPKEFAWLIEYVLNDKYKTAEDALRIRSTLPPDVTSQLPLTAAGAQEPTKLKSEVGSQLVQLKAADAEVAVWLKSYPNDYTPPPAAVAAVKPAPSVEKSKDVAQKKPGVPAGKQISTKELRALIKKLNAESIADKAAADAEIVRLKSQLANSATVSNPAGGGAPTPPVSSRAVPSENFGTFDTKPSSTRQ